MPRRLEFGAKPSSETVREARPTGRPWSLSSPDRDLMLLSVQGMPYVAH